MTTSGTRILRFARKWILLFAGGFLLGGAVTVGAAVGLVALAVVRPDALPTIPRLRAPWETPPAPHPVADADTAAFAGLRPLPPPPAGPLSGLTVYLSAGHGLLLHRQNHDGEPISWGTQRTPRYGMVEDEWTAEFAANWLAPALEAAGATVLALRERDRNPEAVVIDDRREGFAAYGVEGVYVDPLAEGGDVTRLVAGGSATWRLTVPTDGQWYLYARWTEDIDQDATAIYTVTTAAGAREIVVDQQHHGGHWWPLGDDCLSGGSTVEVTLTGAGDAPLSADAVRLGGGTYRVLLPWNYRIREAEHYRVSFTHQLERLGAPEWLGTYACGTPVSDMRLRPHWASWAGEYDDDAVYVSIHTNASPRGRPKGLTAFYGVDSNPPTPADPESVRLATLLDRHVHKSVSKRDRGYLNRGTRPGDYSEVSPVHNTLPAALLEMGFHDNPEEAKRLQTAQYRHDAAEGIVEGLIEWRSTRTMPPPFPVTRDPDRSWAIVEGM